MKYNERQLRPIIFSLHTAQAGIEAVIIKGEEESIFDYRKDEPKMYELYMKINEVLCELHELEDN